MTLRSITHFTGKRYTRHWIILIMMLCIMLRVRAQEQMVIAGVIADSETLEAVAYASVYVSGTSSEGAEADSNGIFRFLSARDSGTLVISAMGYANTKVPFNRDTSRHLVVYLKPASSQLNEVMIRGKRAKYRNRNNPAVALIRKVIDHKTDNNALNQERYTFRKYEKLTLSLSLKKDSTAKPWLLRKYPFLQTHTDSLSTPRRFLVPIYLSEKSTVHSIKDRQARRPVVTGVKQSRIDQYIDENGLDEFLDKIYGEPDVFEHDIALGNRRFLSPVAESAPLFYEYYLRDTDKTVTPWQIDVMVRPRNDQDVLFNGHLYVTLDGHFAVTKAALSVGNNVNISWIDDIRIAMQYKSDTTGKYHLYKSTMSLNMGVFKNGAEIFGEKNYIISGFTAQADQPDIIQYDTSVKVPDVSGNYGHVDRPESLSAGDMSALHNVDSLKVSKSFRRSMAWGAFFLSQYADAGVVEFGPIGSFYSFNPVEGSRMKFGGRTTGAFSTRVVLEGYMAYGTLDRLLKYHISGTYSLTDRSVYQFPVRAVSLSYTSDVQVPGQEFAYSSSDNLLLSFRRGRNDKMWYNRRWKVEYFHETGQHISFRLGLSGQWLIGNGILAFESMKRTSSGESLELHSSEIYGELRWAPHETFFQGKRYRRPIDNGYPVFTFQSAFGIKGFAGGQYNYGRIGLHVKKRFFLSQFGHLDLSAEAGTILGSLPYPLLLIHRANQTYNYQASSYNLMNFLEFVSDRHAGINVQHSLNGFLLNKVPLIRKLRLREILCMKVLWGSLSDNNNPGYQQELFKFPQTQRGQSFIHSLGDKPYIEGGIGISNIFKVLRMDLVHRFTYRNNSDISRWGVRVNLNVDF